MRKWAASLSILLVIALFCFLSVGLASADSYTYTLSGGTLPGIPLVVDDDLEVKVNGKTVFVDDDGYSTLDARATWKGTPITFSASPGDVLQIIATNPGGADIELSPLYLHVNGQSLKLSSGVPLRKSDDVGEFFSESFTISIPTPLVSILDYFPSPVHGGEDVNVKVSWRNIPAGWKLNVSLEESEGNVTRLAEDVSKMVSGSGEETFKLKVYPTTETHDEAKVCACLYSEKGELKILDRKDIIVHPKTPSLYLYILFIAIILFILLPLVVLRKGSKKGIEVATSPKITLESKTNIKKEDSLPISKSITIERAIYDPCKRDFIEGLLPRMKEWINRYDPGAYWFATSIQNNTDRAIEEWDVEIETSSALKIKEAKIEGVDEKIPQESHLGSFKLSVSKAHGYTIPKGGQRRVYFKLRADKPKTTYEISGVFKSAISGDVSIRPKEFKYLCDTGVSSEAVKVELKKTFSEKDAARLANTFRIVQETRSSYCNTGTTAREINKKFDILKMYFTEKMFLNEVENVQRRINAELREDERLDGKHVEEVKDFCEKFTEMWIAKFLR